MLTDFQHISPFKWTWIRELHRGATTGSAGLHIQFSHLHTTFRPKQYTILGNCLSSVLSSCCSIHLIFLRLSPSLYTFLPISQYRRQNVVAGKLASWEQHEYILQEICIARVLKMQDKFQQMLNTVSSLSICSKSSKFSLYTINSQLPFS